jgi:hypothetical protein
MLLKYCTRQTLRAPVDVMRQLPKPREMMATLPTQRALEHLVVLGRHREQRQVEHVRGVARPARFQLALQFVQQRRRVHRARGDLDRHQVVASAVARGREHGGRQRRRLEPVRQQLARAVELDDPPDAGEHAFLHVQRALAVDLDADLAVAEHLVGDRLRARRHAAHVEHRMRRTGLPLVHHREQAGEGVAGDGERCGVLGLGHARHFEGPHVARHGEVLQFLFLDVRPGARHADGDRKGFRRHRCLSDSGQGPRRS